MLPYDPLTDRVLLIRQFLPGAFVAGQAPRPLQVIAGMVDEGEIDEAAALTGDPTYFPDNPRVSSSS